MDPKIGTANPKTVAKSEKMAKILNTRGTSRHLDSVHEKPEELGSLFMAC
ncbi:MAG TPA: hypothetical protein VFC44_00165 [Candidatus Saccharimonadales bacterium]|nr:hypothetical protein [Candidatus Saccharimonadales bacterium]